VEAAALGFEGGVLEVVGTLGLSVAACSEDAVTDPAEGAGFETGGFGFGGRPAGAATAPVAVVGTAVDPAEGAEEAVVEGAVATGSVDVGALCGSMPVSPCEAEPDVGSGTVDSTFESPLAVLCPDSAVEPGSATTCGGSGFDPGSVWSWVGSLATSSVVSSGSAGSTVCGSVTTTSCGGRACTMGSAGMASVAEPASEVSTRFSVEPSTFWFDGSVDPGSAATSSADESATASGPVPTTTSASD
jgi:hypothetical protein